MDGSNAPWSEQFRAAGEKWTDLEAAAQILEDSKSAVLAQKVSEQGDIPVNRAENNVKSSRFWRDHIEKIVEARRLANRAKIELEYIKMRYYEWQSSQANTRAELRSLGSTT